MSEESVTVDAPRSVKEIRELLPKIPELSDEEWQLLDLKILNFINKYGDFVPKLEAFLKDRAVPKDVEKLLRGKARWMYAGRFAGDGGLAIKFDDAKKIVEAQCVGRAQLKKLHKDFPMLDEEEAYPNFTKHDLLVYIGKIGEWRERLEMLK